MQIVYTEVDLSSILSESAIQSKVVKPTDYTGIWAKKISGSWVIHFTQPSGKVVERNFIPAFPNPILSGVVYNPCYGEETPIFDTNGQVVNLHYDSSESRLKCGAAN